MTYGRTSFCLGNARETVKRKRRKSKEKERKEKKGKRRKESRNQRKGVGGGLIIGC